MKNTMHPHQAVTVRASELLEEMEPGYAYHRHQIAALLDDKPRAAVHDALDALVEGGKIWRTKVDTRHQYIRLSDADLERIAVSRADRTQAPAWATRTLTGYERQNQQFQQLCELTRR